MKTLIIVICLILLLGCNVEPKVGDWYESLKTGRRHKLNHIFDASFELEQFNKRFSKELVGEKKIDELDFEYLVNRRRLLQIYVYNKYQLYYLSDYYESVGDMFITNAVTQKQLKEDFRKID